jgi:hypothetical protein
VFENHGGLWDSHRNVRNRAQEDMCQATGMSPLPKYQADGGTGIANIMEWLLGSDNSAQDRNAFFPQGCGGSDLQRHEQAVRKAGRGSVTRVLSRP